MPLGEALCYQIEVQRKLQEQLEVQKKLQTRIEAQGKYLQAILEKAQKSLCFDNNRSSGSLEATRAQRTDFDLPLSGLMENVGRVCEEKHSEVREVRSEENIEKRNDSGFQLYQEGRDEAEDRSLLLLDLNVKGSSGEMVGGSRGNDLISESKRRGCKPALTVDSALADTSDAVIVRIELISSLCFLQFKSLYCGLLFC